MRRSYILTSIVSASLALTLIYLYTGPQIDGSKIVLMDELAPIALPCLKFRLTDFRGRPIWRSDRAYIRFLQDNGVRIAIVRNDNGEHEALIGFLDSLRIRKLYAEAEQNGLAVPTAPFSSRIGQ